MKKRPPPFENVKGGGRFFQVQEILNLMTLSHSVRGFFAAHLHLSHIFSSKPPKII